VIVLPELTVDAMVRQELGRWLRESHHPFALVVAGSFHEQGVGPTEAAAPRHNVCHVLDRWGGELLAHVKLRPMRAGSDARPLDEDLTGGNKIELLLAPFGLIGVAICLDFCEIGDTPVTDLWRTAGPALMLVPSMGRESTNSAHRSKAHELALQHGTATLVASQHDTNPEGRGLCWYPSHENETDRATLEAEGIPVLHGHLTWTRG
jgi:predicted amidohydrolase